MFDSKRLAEILNNFRKVHLLVVGDLMLDRFIWGEVERLSPEAPVPVLRVCSESSRPGWRCQCGPQRQKFGGTGVRVWGGGRGRGG